MMKTLVVYDSLYGNTKAIAEAIAGAIPGQVQVLQASQLEAGPLRTSVLETVDLLIIGSPTHGAMPSPATLSLMERIPAPLQAGARAATFDTRLTWPFLERWGGFAAAKIADKLREKGWTLVGEPGGFFVKGLKKGPLKRGEIERAASWAKEITKAL
jgi:flavodoxin